MYIYSFTELEAECQMNFTNIKLQKLLEKLYPFTDKRDFVELMIWPKFLYLKIEDNETNLPKLVSLENPLKCLLNLFFLFYCLFISSWLMS